MTAKQQYLGLHLVFLAVGVVAAILVIGTHLGDAVIKDEVEFYRAAVPHSSLLHFTYYGGEYGAGGSRTQINPTWHPATYIILLRVWLVTFGATPAHARLFGVFCLVLAFAGTGLLLVRRCWLTLSEALAWMGVSCSLPVVAAGAMLLDIDGTLLLVLIPLIVLIVGDIIASGGPPSRRAITQVALFFCALLLVKIVAAIFLPVAVAIMLALCRRRLFEWGRWALAFTFGTLLFITIWGGVTIGTDLLFWGPLRDNFGRTSTLLGSLPLGLFPVYVIRDFMKLAGWLGLALLVQTAGGAIKGLSMTRRQRLEVADPSSIAWDNRILFLRVFLLLSGSTYILIGRSFVYGFPKYLVPLLPLAVLLIVIDARPFLSRLRGLSAWLIFGLGFVLSFVVFTSRGNPILAELASFGALDHVDRFSRLVNFFRFALPEILLLTALVLVVVYLARRNVLILSHFEGLTVITLIVTAAYGLSASIDTARVSGSVIYDYGTSGGGEVVRLLAKDGVLPGTVIGPLEIVYNIPELRRFIFVNVVFGDPTLARKTLNIRPLILISTPEVERRLAELSISGLDSPQRVEVRGSYTVSWYNSNSPSQIGGDDVR